MSDVSKSVFCGICERFHFPGDDAACARFFVGSRLEQPQKEPKPGPKDDGCYGLDWRKFIGKDSDAAEANKLAIKRKDIYDALRKKAVEAGAIGERRFGPGRENGPNQQSAPSTKQKLI